MAISPLQMSSNTVSDAVITKGAETVINPSKTYQLNLDTGEIENRFIDGRDAVRQAIYKMILTPRVRYRIYGTDYGSELESLVAENLPFEMLEMEITRYATECLLIDDRILNVRDFVVAQEGDVLSIGFIVDLMDGDSWYEEVKI